jgi:hypothetical protein
VAKMRAREMGSAPQVQHDPRQQQRAISQQSAFCALPYALERCASRVLKRLRDRCRPQWCLSFYRYLTDLARPLLPQATLRLARIYRVDYFYLTDLDKARGRRG